MMAKFSWFHQPVGKYKDVRSKTLAEKEFFDNLFDVGAERTRL